MPTPEAVLLLILLALLLDVSLKTWWASGLSGQYICWAIDIRFFINFNPGTFLWWWCITGVAINIFGFSRDIGKSRDCSRSRPIWWNCEHSCGWFKYLFLPCFVQRTWVGYLPFFFSKLVVLLMLIPHVKDTSMVRSIEPWHQGSKGSWFCKSCIKFAGANGQSSVNMASLLQCFNPSVSWQPTIHQSGSVCWVIFK